MAVADISYDSPISCLLPLLSGPTFGAVVCALGLSATVGDLAELDADNRLTKLRDIGYGRAGEIRRALEAAGCD
jgi:hypothetical protein